MRAWIPITSFLISVFFSGCSTVSHLDQLLTLKAISDEQKAMDKEVDKQDKKFKSLIAEIQKGTIKEYANKKSVIRKFGEPISIENMEKDVQLQETWMYRYCAKFFDSDKAYLKFDQEGKLIDWQYEQAPPQENKKVPQ